MLPPSPQLPSTHSLNWDQYYHIQHQGSTVPHTAQGTH